MKRSNSTAGVAGFHSRSTPNLQASGLLLHKHFLLLSPRLFNASSTVSKSHFTLENNCISTVSMLLLKAVSRLVIPESKSCSFLFVRLIGWEMLMTLHRSLNHLIRSIHRTYRNWFVQGSNESRAHS